MAPDVDDANQWGAVVADVRFRAVRQECDVSGSGQSGNRLDLVTLHVTITDTVSPSGLP